MQTITSIKKIRQTMKSIRESGKTIGFVPTMGFLHRGHTTLMDIARQKCDVLVVSIFVNPLQFAPNEDLERYPRDPAGDSAKCESHKVDFLFTPADFYSENHSTTVTVGGLTNGLCGTSRPTHFDGVTTVVARLFGIVNPDIAVFGEKDFQQLAIIRRMVRDLALPVTVVGGPLVRDEDGLALSSRNRFLSSEQRNRALSLRLSLEAIRSGVQSGVKDVNTLLNTARSVLDVDEVDYLDVRDPDSLEPVKEITSSARAFVAAKFGNTRLIDNMDVSK